MKNNYTILKFAIACIVVFGPIKSFAQLKADFSADITSGCTPVVVNFTDLSTGNPTSYFWDFGNGTVSTEKNPGLIYIKPGSYNIKLVVSNGNGKDSVVKQSYINVYALPTIDFSASVLDGCSPLNVAFQDKSSANSGTISEYVWDFGDGSVSKEVNPVHVFNGADSFSVTLSVVTSFGCKQTTTKTDFIKIPSSVKSGFGYTYTNICQPPAQIDFDNESVSTGSVSYLWNFGDGTTSILENPSHMYAAGGNYTITLIAKTINGCSDTTSQNISIGSVKADFIVQDSICTNQKLVLKNSSNPVPSIVSWNFGDGGTSSVLNPVHVFTKAGTYNVTMTGNYGSCLGTVTRVITVTDKPVTSFTANGPVVSCSVPLNVNFKNTSTGAATYKWIFGDGSTSSEINPVHSYNSEGSFTVKLVSYNTNGCSDTVIVSNFVRVGPPKILGFEDLPSRGCAPNLVNFKALVVSPVPVVSYNWDFGDGTSSTLAKPQHTYNNIGSYDVTLTVSAGSGCTSTYVLNDAVEVGHLPKVDFTAQPRAVCSYLPVSFFDKSSSDVNEWFWIFGDGGTSTIQNPNHIYLDTGYFNVTLIAKNNNCADTLTFNDYVQIYPPVAKFSVKMDCRIPYSRNFTDNSVGAKTWSWDFGDGNTSNMKSPVHIYNTAGWYKVVLKVTNGDCESIKNDSVYIIDDNPSFTYEPSVALCKNQDVVFTASGFMPRNYDSLAWDFSDGSKLKVPSDSSVVSHRFLKTGTFNPFLITTDRNKCKDTVDNKLSMVVYGPSANFTNPQGACMNSIFTFSDSSKSDGLHPIQNWKWSYGDGIVENKSSSPFTHVYNRTGWLNVSLVVTDSYGCTDSIIKNNNVVVSNPKAIFFPTDSVTCSSTNIKFRSQSTGVSPTYLWDFGDGNSSVLSNPEHHYQTQGLFTVKLVITDMFGCRDSIVKPDYISISNPSASFILNDTIGQCPPLLTQPKNTSSNYQSITWQFGDGLSSASLDPQHYYNQAGTFNMKLIVKGNGNCYDSASKTILVKGPSGTLNYPVIKACAPTSVTLTSTAKNVAEFVWDFNNGVIIHTTDTTAKYNYTQYGSYLPKLVLVDSAGCKVSVENKDRILIADLKAGIRQVANNKEFCDSTLKLFNDSSIAYYDTIQSYHWDFGDNKVYDGKNANHFFENSGTYNVKLSVTSSLGCKSEAMLPVKVQVNKSPSVSINVKDSVCESSVTSFTAINQSLDNNLKWFWNFGDGDNSSLQNPEHVYKEGGKYNASLKVVAASGCTTLKNTPVNIFKKPVVNAGADTTICLGNSVVLEPSGAATYKWMANPSLSCTNCNTPTAKPGSATWYHATGYTVNGCEANDSILVNVIQPLNLVAGNGGVLCLGQSFTLKASGADKYEWSPKQYLDNPYSATPRFTPSAPANITYSVIGKDNKNCFTDTASVTMKVYPVPTIQITNKDLVANAGYPVKLETTSSPDVIRWKWGPVTGLDNPYVAEPTLTPGKSGTYTVVATNEGGCTSTDQLTIAVLCDGRNIFIPNTFSPNNDGMNDRFYPHGKGILTIRSMQIFNRWGQIVFEKVNFAANLYSEGWDGTFKGQPQGVDVYVYMMEVVCDNGTLNKINGNVTLLR